MTWSLCPGSARWARPATLRPRGERTPACKAALGGSREEERTPVTGAPLPRATPLLPANAARTQPRRANAPPSRGADLRVSQKAFKPKPDVESRLEIRSRHTCRRDQPLLSALNLQRTRQDSGAGPPGSRGLRRPERARGPPCSPKSSPACALGASRPRLQGHHSSCEILERELVKTQGTEEHIPGGSRVPGASPAQPAEGTGRAPPREPHQASCTGRQRGQATGAGDSASLSGQS